MKRTKVLMIVLGVTALSPGVTRVVVGQYEDPLSIEARIAPA